MHAFTEKHCQSCCALRAKATCCTPVGTWKANLGLRVIEAVAHERRFHRLVERHHERSSTKIPTPRKSTSCATANRTKLLERPPGSSLAGVKRGAPAGSSKETSAQRLPRARALSNTQTHLNTRATPTTTRENKRDQERIYIDRMLGHRNFPAKKFSFLALFGL